MRMSAESSEGVLAVNLKNPAHLVELQRRGTMAGRHPFATLRVRMTPEAQVAAESVAVRLRDQVDLAEARRSSNSSALPAIPKIGIVAHGQKHVVQRR